MPRTLIRTHAEMEQSARAMVDHRNRNPDKEPTWTLRWEEVDNDFSTLVWRSTNRRFHIVRVALPVAPPQEMFLLLEHDGAAAGASAAVFGPADLGFSRGAFPRVDFALSEAQILQWQNDHWDDLDVPASYDAHRLARFRWPITGAGTRGALAVESRDGRIVASVIGMGRTRSGAATPTAPEWYAQVDVDDVVLKAVPARRLVVHLARRLFSRRR
jgi:hypothetical protein